MSRACDSPNRLTTEEVGLRRGRPRPSTACEAVSDARSVVIILVNEGQASGPQTKQGLDKFLGT